LVERGLILEPYQVDRKTNEIKALPEFIEQLALKGVQPLHPSRTHPALARAEDTDSRGE
jgi:hypothetical protein